MEDRLSHSGAFGCGQMPPADVKVRDLHTESVCIFFLRMVLEFIGASCISRHAKAPRLATAQDWKLRNVASTCISLTKEA